MTNHLSAWEDPVDGLGLYFRGRAGGSIRGGPEQTHKSDDGERVVEPPQAAAGRLGKPRSYVYAERDCYRPQDSKKNGKDLDHDAEVMGGERRQSSCHGGQLLPRGRAA